MEQKEEFDFFEINTNDFDFFDIDVTYEQAINILKSCLNRIEIRGEFLYIVKKAIMKILTEGNLTTKSINNIDKNVYDDIAKILKD